jgi:hypothetical protein
MGRSYRNRTAELKRLVEILRNQGIYGVEVLDIMLANLIQSYALQINIEPLTKYELEYVWIKLIY